VRQRDEGAVVDTHPRKINASSASRSSFWLPTSSIFNRVLSMSEEASAIVPIEG
jgi:hypothetical protein